MRTKAGRLGHKIWRRSTNLDLAPAHFCALLTIQVGPCRLRRPSLPNRDSVVLWAHDPGNVG